MNRWQFGLLAALMSLLVLVLAGCIPPADAVTPPRDEATSAPSTPPETEASGEEESPGGDLTAEPLPTVTPTPAVTPLPDEVAIYAAVVRQLYTLDHTFERAPAWPYLYILRVTDDRIGGELGSERDARTLPEDVQQGITAALSDLPAEVRWVDSWEDTPLDDMGRVEGGDGVLVTLGNIHPQADGSVHVPASLHCGNLCATGLTYILAEVDGAWQVTGTTGPVCVSSWPGFEISLTVRRCVRA